MPYNCLFEHMPKFHSYGYPKIFFAVHKDGQVITKRAPRIYMIDSKSKHSVIAKYNDTPGNQLSVLLN